MFEFDLGFGSEIGLTIYHINPLHDASGSCTICQHAPLEQQAIWGNAEMHKTMED